MAPYLAAHVQDVGTRGLPSPAVTCQLAEVVVHDGTVNSGKYSAFMRERVEPRQWRRVSCENIVVLFNPIAWEEECLGGHVSVDDCATGWTSKIARMLFYERGNLAKSRKNEERLPSHSHQARTPNHE